MTSRRHAARDAADRSVEELEVVLSAAQSTSDELVAVAAHPSLNEDLALLLLRRRDLSAEVLEALKRNGRTLKNRKVRLALITHQKAPKHVSLPEVRHLFTFELMKVALLPHTPADVKIAAEEVLISRLETISSGERLSLAKQGSGAIASALLLDVEKRIAQAAMDNPRLTEILVIRALQRQCSMQDPTPHLAPDICRHSKWSQRKEVRAVLLRHPFTPLAQAIIFAKALPAYLVRDVLKKSRLPENVKSYLQEMSDRSVRKP